MGKGTGNNGRKRTNHRFKKRCEYPNCDKRARHLIENKYYCNKHYDNI